MLPVSRPCLMAKKKRSRKPKTQARFPRLKCEWAGEPLTSATVNHFAHILNLTEDHQKLLRKTNGGTPDRVDFTWQSPNAEPQESHLDNFLGIDNRPFGPDRQADIISVTLSYRDYLPTSALPIAYVDRDNLLLTFTSGPRHGQIWLLIWSPPFTGEKYNCDDHVFFVADSLADFLNSLSKTDDPYDPATIALDSPKVRGKQLATMLKTLGCKPFKYKGVTSQTALPPAWQWPKYRRTDEDSPAFLSVEKNHTYGYAPKCDERPTGHKMLRIDVTKSERRQCLRDLLELIGDHGKLVDA